MISKLFQMPAESEAAGLTYPIDALEDKLAHSLMPKYQTPGYFIGEFFEVVNSPNEILASLQPGPVKAAREIGGGGINEINRCAG